MRQEAEPQKKKSKKWWIIGGIIAVVIIGSIFSGDGDKKEEKKSEAHTVATKQEPAEATPPVTNLGLTVEQFEARYNKFAKEFNSKISDKRLHLKAIVIDKKQLAETGFMSGCSTKNTCVIGPVLSNKKYIHWLSVNTSGDGTLKTGAIAMSHMFIASAAAIHSVDKYNETAETVVKLLNESELDGPSVKTIYKDYKMDLTRSSKIGNMLSIERAE